MEMILTGNMITAKEAESSGLVAKVVPNTEVRTTINLGSRVEHNVFSGSKYPDDFI